MGVESFNRGAMMMNAEFIDAVLIKAGHKPKRDWTSPTVKETTPPPRILADVVELTPRDLAPGAVIWAADDV